MVATMKRMLAAMPLLLAGGLVSADEVLPASDTASEASTQPSTLTEITVTARVPVEQAAESRATVSGETLLQSGLNNLTDLDGRLPGLTTQASNPRTTGFSIRGLGNNQANDGLDSSVGLFSDGVYLARQAYGAFGLYDLEDVTLLRGPSGATRGFGSTAGELELRTRAPSFIPGAEGALSLGNLGYQQLTAAVTGPLLAEQLAGRFSLYTQRRDGLIENVFDGSRLNDQDRLGLRGQLLWTPDARLRVRLKLEHDEFDERCCASQLLGPVRPGIQASDDYMGYERPGTNPYDRVADKDVTPMGRLQQQGVTVATEWDLAPRHQLISLTSARSLAYDPARNDDGASLRLVTGFVTSDSHQLGQEFRWQADYARARSVLGVSWLRQDVAGREVGVLGDEIALWTLGGLLRQRLPFATRQNSGFLINAILPPQTLDGLAVSRPYRQLSDSYSGFGSVDWLLRDDTTLTTGLRYTLSRREADISRSRSGGNPGASPLSLTNSLAPLEDVLGVDLGPLTFDGLIDSLVGPPFERHDSREDEGVSGRVTLQHQLSDRHQLHAGVSRGYKSGGINLDALSPRIAPQFAAEIAEGAELGWRANWPAQRLTAGLVLYHTDVRNFQALTYDDGDGLVDSPRQNNVISIPKVRLQGAELDVSALFRRGLSLALGVAYNRAISQDFRRAPNEDTGVSDKDLSGRQLYQAPRWSGHAGVQQTFALGQGFMGHVGVDHRFRSGTFAAVEQSRNSFIDAYQITDVRLGARRASGAWGIEAWVRNVFDEEYLASVSGLYGLGDYAGFAGDPRTYGITLDARWGQ